MVIYRCGQFEITNGVWEGCKNLAELLEGFPNMPLDLCTMHRELHDKGIPIRCWKCGEDKDETTKGCKDIR